MRTLLLKRGIPEVVGEGRVEKIGIDPREAHEVGLLSDQTDSPVVFNYRGPHNFYINVYDHRPEVKKAFVDGNDTELLEVFADTPCLAGYRIKDNVQYVVIAPIGTPDIRDGGPQEALILTKRGLYDSKVYKCLVDARGRASVHIDTGIALVKRRTD